MVNTLAQYDKEANACRDLFLKKAADYGTSWRVYRLISVADQIYIKARRIRNIQELKVQQVGDDIRSEFMGIYNYCIIGLIQLSVNDERVEYLPVDALEKLYDKYYTEARNLMQQKNHDYGEAWRDMSEESFTDLILARILRIKQIIRNQGQTTISEGIDANLLDMMNYSMFALISKTENEN